MVVPLPRYVMTASETQRLVVVQNGLRHELRQSYAFPQHCRDALFNALQSVSIAYTFGFHRYTRENRAAFVRLYNNGHREVVNYFRAMEWLEEQDVML